MKTKLIFRTTFCLTISLLIFSFFCFSSCKKAPEEKAISKNIHPLDGTIVTTLPPHTTGVFYWNNTSEAYKAYQSSQWNTSGSNSAFDLSTMSNSATKDFVDVLKTNGIDPQNKENIDNLFSEGVAFISANSDIAVNPDPKVEPLSFGVVIKAKDQALVAKLAESIKKGLEAQGKTVTPVDISAGKALQFSIQIDKDDPTSNKEFFFGWQKNFATLGTKKSDVEAVLSGGQGNLPQALITDLFQRSIKQFPPQKTQYGFGYIDLQATSKLLLTQDQINKDITQKIAELPIEAAAMAVGMNTTPYTEAHVLYAAKTESQKQLFDNIKQSTSVELLKAISTEPMVFISLDGETIKNAKESYLQNANSPSAQAMAPQLDVINNIKRIGISAKIAPVGATMLPIPDLMVLFDTSDALKLNDTLVQLFSGLMAQGGDPLSSQKWQNKKIAGQDVKYFLTPLGIGVFLTSTPSLLVVASSEGQMKAALDSIKDSSKVFTASIGNEAKAAFAENVSCANIYLNFGQVSSLLQNLGGMAQMYAANNPELQKMLEPKQLESLRKLGAMVASITLEDGALVLKSSYIATESKPN